MKRKLLIMFLISITFLNFNYGYITHAEDQIPKPTLEPIKEKAKIHGS